MAREKSDDHRLSRNILDRVRADSEGFLHARDRNEAPVDDMSNDWPEVWGRRIGRSLGAVFFIVLIIWLYNFLTGAG